MATAVKTKTPKKIPQAPPGYDGRTLRRCAGCQTSIRTRRQTLCKPCKEAFLLKRMSPEDLGRRDARAGALGFADWYEYTDS